MNTFEPEFANNVISNAPLKKVASNDKNSYLNKLNTLYIQEEELLNLDKALALDNSSLFDVHTWSEYPEVNHAIDYLYEEVQSLVGYEKNSSVQKKHVKVIVLDLYVKWLTCPTMYSSYYRAHWYYREINGRYNKLHISKVTIKVINALENLGYLTVDAHLKLTR